MSSTDDHVGERARPNVVFIVGDNVGWGDISCYGGTAPTPRIDAFAAEGMRFRNYNVEAQCTPTRSALLSGRLPIRTGNCSVPLPGQGDYGLAPWEYTLGELSVIDLRLLANDLLTRTLRRPRSGARHAPAETCRAGPLHAGARPPMLWLGCVDRTEAGGLPAIGHPGPRWRRTCRFVDPGE